MSIKNLTLEELTERNFDSLKFCGHYSDQQMMIRKIGTEEIYSEAIDLVPCLFEYEETDQPISNEETFKGVSRPNNQII